MWIKAGQLDGFKSSRFLFQNQGRSNNHRAGQTQDIASVWSFSTESSPFDSIRSFVKTRKVQMSKDPLWRESCCVSIDHKIKIMKINLPNGNKPISKNSHYLFLTEFKFVYLADKMETFFFVLHKSCDQQQDDYFWRKCRRKRQQEVVGGWWSGMFF